MTRQILTGTVVVLTVELFPFSGFANNMFFIVWATRGGMTFHKLMYN